MVEGSMATTRPARRRQGAARILGSGTTPLNKVRKLVALGYDEAAADDMVTNAQVGPSMAMFYEHLPKPEYDEDKL